MTHELAKLDAESFFDRRLRDHGVTILTGLTTPAERKERIRAAILSCGLEATIIGKTAGGKTETYAQSFERLYGEALKRKT